MSYFWSRGTLYLAVSSQAAEENPFESIHHETPALDPLGLRLMNYCDRLAYEQPANSAYLNELTQIVAELYRDSLLTPEQRAELPHALRQEVEISGEGLRLVSSEALEPETEVLCWLSFPAYPFSTLQVPAQVVSCTESGADPLVYQLELSFTQISEADRAEVIKFVNQLERTQRSHAMSN